MDTEKKIQLGGGVEGEPCLRLYVLAKARVGADV